MADRTLQEVASKQALLAAGDEMPTCRGCGDNQPITANHQSHQGLFS
jgi:hypothetical protein